MPVSREAILTGATLRAEFSRAIATYAANGSGAISLSLLSSGEAQADAVYDAWALGRNDVRYLILLRRLLLDLSPEATRRAIFALSLATPHPDIFWTELNWIPSDIKKQLRQCFQWSSAEILHMVAQVQPEEWGRGTLGQSLDMLMYEDPNVLEKLRQAVALAMSTSLSLAARIATLELCHSEDQRQELSLLLRDNHDLSKDGYFVEVARTVKEFGSIDMY